MHTIAMRVAQVETLNPLFRRITLRSTQGGVLPTFDARAHVRVRSGATEEWCHYSLIDLSTAPEADAAPKQCTLGVRLDAAGLTDISSLPGIALVPLDVRDERSVSELAGQIGGKVDSVVNTAALQRGFGIAARRGTDVAKAEMEINYFGLLRLAQAFGPALRGGSADGTAHACAWVNVLSVYALANYPAQGTFSASKAAALSLSQCLRAAMRPAGVRVVNVSPGPVDDDWNQNMPPPKARPHCAGLGHRQGLERRGGRRLPQRYRAGMAEPLARQPQSGRT